MNILTKIYTCIFSFINSATFSGVNLILNITIVGLFKTFTAILTGGYKKLVDFLIYYRTKWNVKKNSRKYVDQTLQKCKLDLLLNILKLVSKFHITPQTHNEN